MGEEEQHRTETYRSMISVSMEGFRALQYLNGAASAAMLASIGQPAGGLPKAVAAKALLSFAIGLALGTSCYVTSYQTQFTLYNEPSPSGPNRPAKPRSHMNWVNATRILAIASLGMFCLGTGVVVLGVLGAN